MYLIYANYVFCLNEVLILFLFATFSTMCLFFEFNEPCSVYFVSKLSRGHFKACVWYAFYVCIT